MFVYLLIRVAAVSRIKEYAPEKRWDFFTRNLFLMQVLTVITFLITVVEKPSKPIPLLFFKLLTISVISCVVHGLRNMEFLFGVGKVSLISPAVSWGIALAKFGPIFTK